MMTMVMKMIAPPRQPLAAALSLRCTVDAQDKNGAYRIDAGMGEGLRNSLVYKLSYYRFWDMPTARGKPGFDRVRQMVIGYQNYELEYFEEVLTTSNWMMRVYERKKAPNVDSGMENALS